MFDNILVNEICPSCGKMGEWDWKTKDLACVLDCYRPLPNCWETGDLLRPFRIGLPVYRAFPLDKSAGVWENQAERTEAQATIPEEFIGKLNYVDVVGSCPHCGEFYQGRMRVDKDGHLREGIECLRSGRSK